MLEISDHLHMSEKLLVCLLCVLRFGEIDLWLRLPKTVCYFYEDEVSILVEQDLEDEEDC